MAVMIGYKQKAGQVATCKGSQFQNYPSMQKNKSVFNANFKQSNSNVIVKLWD